MSVEDILNDEAATSGYDMDWLPEGFKRIDGYITASKPVGRGDKPLYKDEPVCGDFKVVALTRDNQSSSWASEIEFVDYDGKRKTIPVQHSLIAGDGAAVREALANAGLQMPTDRWGREKFSYLLAKYRSPKRVTTYPTPGLYRHQEGGTFICPSGEAITENNAEGGNVEHRLPSVPKGPFVKGTLKPYQVAAAEIFANQRLPHVGLGILTGCAGVLVDFGELANIALWIMGPSSGGKTWMQIAGAAQWGSPHNNNCVLMTPNGTVNALDYDYSVGSGASLHFDEGALSDAKTLYQLGFRFYSGVGRRRLRAQKGGDIIRQHTQNWCGCLTVSSEKALSAVAAEAGHARLTGSAVRMPSVDISKIERIDPNEAHRLKQVMMDNYGHIGPGLVRYLLDQGLAAAGGAAIIQTKVAQAVQVLVGSESNPATVRAAQVFAVFAVTGQYLIDAGLLPGVTIADVWRCVKWGWESFLESDDAAPLKTEENAANELMEVLYANQARVQPTGDQGNYQELYAVYDGDHVYMLLSQLPKMKLSAGRLAIQKALVARDELAKNGDRWVFHRIPGGPDVRVPHWRLKVKWRPSSQNATAVEDAVAAVHSAAAASEAATDPELDVKTRSGGRPEVAGNRFLENRGPTRH